MFTEFSKESDRFHTCLAVAATQQRKEWDHHPHGSVVTDTDDSDLDDKDSVMPLLIYPENSEDEEYLRDPPSADPTTEPGTPSEKPTGKLTSKPDYNTLSEPSAPTREDYMGHLSPKDIERYQKGSYPPIFTTLEERTKEAPWGDTRKSVFWAKTRSWRQEKTS